MENTVELVKDFKEFAYAVSHDLGAPLRAVVEFSRMLKEERPDVSPENASLYLSLIVENGEKAQQMLTALTEYSRLNTRAQPFAAADCGLLLHEAMVDLTDRISASKAHLSLSPLPTLRVDAGQICRLFEALLTNALTFHTPGSAPSIEVSAKPENDAWQFTVRDKGIGIDPRFHEQIFLPFKRLHPEEDYPGVGMGLTLARKIVEHHGGHLWVESAPAQGAAFHFSLPRSKEK